MGNLAFGSIKIKSNDEELLQNLQEMAEEHEAFTYDSEPAISCEDGLLSISFCGGWNCADAFSVFEGLLEDRCYPHWAALVEADVFAYEDEGCNLFGTFTKQIGATTFTYRNMLNELKAFDIPSAIKHFIPFLPSAGQKMEFGEVDLTVISRRSVKNSETIRYKVYISTECDNRTFVFDVQENGDLQEIDSWRGKIRDEDDEEDDGWFDSDSDVINSILYYYARDEHYRK